MIDLNTDEVRSLFQQSFSNIGKIHLKDGRLLFSLQSNYEHRYTQDIPGEALVLQLCVIELSTGSLTRYAVEGFWVSK